MIGAQWLLNRILRGNEEIMKSRCQRLSSKQANWTGDLTQTHSTHMCVRSLYVCVSIFMFLISQWKPLLSSEHCDIGQFLTAWSRGWNERECTENSILQAWSRCHLFCPHTHPSVQSKGHRMSVPSASSNSCFFFESWQQRQWLWGNSLGKEIGEDKIGPSTKCLVLQAEMKMKKRLLSIGDHMLA